MRKQARGIGDVVEHRLGHPVVHQRQQRRAIAVRKRRPVTARHAIDDAALDARNVGESTVARDIGRLRRPRRDGAGARNHEQFAAGYGRIGARLGAVSQQAIERGTFRGAEWPAQLGEMPVRRGDAGDAMGGMRLGETLQQLGEAERRERRPARQREDFGHRVGGARKAGFYSDCVRFARGGPSLS
jgi:hypothetical protein